VLYFVVVFICAAALTPHLYTLGDIIVKKAANEDASDFIKSIAGSVQRAKYNRFFSRALAFSAIILLPFLLRALKKSDKPSSPYPLQKNPKKWTDLLTGIAIATSGFAIMGASIAAMGWFEAKESIDWGKALKRSIQPAISASIIEEMLFRGVFLGVFLRSMKVQKALFFLTLFFAVLHFIMPPDGVRFEVKESLFSGFQFLALCSQRFLNPASFIGEFLTLFILGYALAIARIQTASLWMPIGLHMGWVFAYKLYSRTMSSTEQHTAGLLMGDSLKEGFIPLLLLIISSLCIFLLTKSRCNIFVNK